MNNWSWKRRKNQKVMEKVIENHGIFCNLKRLTNPVKTQIFVSRYETFLSLYQFVAVARSTKGKIPKIHNMVICKFPLS